ncbi:MAG: bifunctional DNA-formamidopyrimidine glycosylase/DNA-(apurinic or apyrimidinic site) lyase [Gammaproteobacteria bacterium]|nr:bifunctional DNA-formamidopyrimidine glycosylase/DNA-(apurinic or apyrimidinic site) lyase [Gammaproteobacteria bacterium]
MPELPEVEVTRLHLTPSLVGREIIGLRVGKPLRWPLNGTAADLVGKRIASLDRRGKYLMIQLSQGELVLHLGMSGSLKYLVQPLPAEPHDHFDLLLDQGLLRLRDPRRFGAVIYLPNRDSPLYQKLLGHWGVEPLSADFHAKLFYQQLHTLNKSIKSVLLQGRVVVGVGNIYANEVLFQAGINPHTIAAKLSLVKVTKLHQAIIRILSQAIQAGGSTLRDFSSGNGQPGHFQLHYFVYGREGSPCLICQADILHTKHEQRSSYFCPNCQK